MCCVSSCFLSSIALRTEHNVSEVKNVPVLTRKRGTIIENRYFFGTELNVCHPTFYWKTKLFSETCLLFIIILLLEYRKSAEIQCQNSFKIKLLVKEFGSVMKHC